MGPVELLPSSGREQPASDELHVRYQRSKDCVFNGSFLSFSLLVSGSKVNKQVSAHAQKVWRREK